MIDLYTWITPNGRKVSILLEELGLDYTAHAINITQNEQHTEKFTAISPNGKIPALVDSDGPDGKPFTVFESGAMLIYLCEKVGSELWPTDARRRSVCLQWLMFQMGGVGPFFGQVHHFWKYAKEDVPYAKERYKKEMLRIYKTLDERLGESEYLAGNDYTIADIATYPWVARISWHPFELEEFPNVKAWFDGLSKREAVQRGMGVPFDE